MERICPDFCEIVEEDVPKWLCISDNGKYGSNDLSNRKFIVATVYITAAAHISSRPRSKGLFLLRPSFRTIFSHSDAYSASIFSLQKLTTILTISSSRAFISALSIFAVFYSTPKLIKDFPCRKSSLECFAMKKLRSVTRCELHTLCCCRCGELFHSLKSNHI